MRALVVGSLLLYCCANALPQTLHSRTLLGGQHGNSSVANANITKEAVTIGGLKCDLIQTGSVWYPTDTSKTYPLLSFAHGWTEGGSLTDGNYADVLETVAAAGYVVIAHHSGLLTECQEIYPLDQQRAIAFVKETAALANRVDWNSKVGIYGHSMGGGATGDNAADTTAIKLYNIGAAVLLHPVARNSRPKIPTFFATGSADKICSPLGVEAWSRRAATPTVFAEMRGANHFECQSREDGIPCPHGWTNYVINWMNCYIKGMKSECDAAYSVCTHPTKPMSKCTPQPGDATPHSKVPCTTSVANPVFTTEGIWSQDKSPEDAHHSGAATAEPKDVLLTERVASRSADFPICGHAVSQYSANLKACSNFRLPVNCKNPAVSPGACKDGGFPRCCKIPDGCGNTPQFWFKRECPPHGTAC